MRIISLRTIRDVWATSFDVNILILWCLIFNIAFNYVDKTDNIMYLTPTIANGNHFREEAQSQKGLQKPHHKANISKELNCICMYRISSCISRKISMKFKIWNWGCRLIDEYSTLSSAPSWHVQWDVYQACPREHGEAASPALCHSHIYFPT